MAGLGIGLLFVVLFFALAIGYTILILFCLTQKRTLEVIDAHNRVVEPDKVWLNLIPLFNLIYPLILNPKISQSIKNQMEENNAAESGDYQLLMGRLYPAITLVRIVIPMTLIQGLAGIGGLVCFIIYWVKIAEYKKKILATKSINGVRNSINNNPDLLD